MRKPQFTLIELRLSHCLTQAELAARAGLHPATIWRAEHGKHEPELTSRRAVAEALGYRPEHINWQPPAA